MILSLIVAIAEDNAMGRNNDLPWKLSTDLAYFKKTTLGKPVLMGRKSYESLGKPLPGRLNIVVSGQQLKLPEGVLLFAQLDKAIDRMQEDHHEEGFIIGGAVIFEQSIPQIQRMYITRVHTAVPDADTFFPTIHHDQWKLLWEEYHAADEKNQHAFTFQKWERFSL